MIVTTQLANNSWTRKLLTFILLLAFHLSANGQNGDIAANWTNNPGISASVDIVREANDGTLIIGYTVSPSIGRFNTDGSAYSWSPPSISDGGGNGAVIDVLVMSSDDIFLGGRFDSPSNALVKIDDTGSVIATFNVGTGFNGDVYALALAANGNLLVGGDFTTYNGTTTGQLVELNPTTGAIVSSAYNNFTAGSGLTIVRDIVVAADNEIIVVGDFGSYDSYATEDIVKIQSDGSHNPAFGTLDLDDGFGDFLADIASISILPDNRIILGGIFDEVNANGNLAGVVLLGSDGSVLTSIANKLGLDQVTHVIAQSDGNILVSGVFTDWGGTTVGNLVKIDDSGNLIAGFNTTGADGPITSVAVLSDNSLAIAGNFDNYDGTASGGLARLANTVAAVVNPRITYSTSFDVSTISFDASFSVSGQTSSPQDIFISEDGTKLYVLGFSVDEVNQYTLSTPFDISTASFDAVAGNPYVISAFQTTPQGLFFNAAGTKMYTTGNGDNEVNQYTLSTSFDITTASHDAIAGNPFSVGSEEDTPLGITFNPAGTKMYISGRDHRPGAGVAPGIHQYSLSTSFDISTASYDIVAGNPLFTPTDEYPTGMAFNADGTKFLYTAQDPGNVNDGIVQYSLSSPYNITTATRDANPFSLSGVDDNPRGLTIDPTGTNMYVVGEENLSVRQYSMSSDVFTETITNDGSVDGSLKIGLIGDTFVNAGSTLTNASHYSITNLPSGFTPVINVSSDGVTATLTLSGSANSHLNSNDLASLQFTFTNAAFTNSLAANVINATSANSNMGIDFNDPTTPLTQASNIIFTNLAATSMTVGWTNGAGANRIVVGRAGGAVINTPIDNNVYSSDAEFGAGTNLGGGDFVVYDGNGVSVPVTGLTPGETYHFRVFEYNGATGNAKYNVTTSSGNPASQLFIATAVFTIDAIADANVDENATYTSVTPATSGATPIGTLTYTLGGADAADFTINSSTGVVSMVVRDFENPEDATPDNVYEVTITATDSHGNNDTEDWTVTVDDVVEAAAFTRAEDNFV